MALTLPTAAAGPRLRLGGGPFRRVAAGASLAFLAWAAVALWRELHAVPLAAVVAEASGIGPGRLAGAAALTALSYLILGLNEWGALRWVEVRAPLSRALGVSFVASAFGHSLGFNLLVGGGLRARLLARSGAGPAQAAAATLYGSVSFALGLCVLAGGGLILARHPGLEALGLGPGGCRALGWSLAAAPGLYLLACAAFRGEARLAGRAYALPDPLWALGQVLAGAADNLATAAVLWALIPAGPPLAAVAAAYPAAVAAGLASGLPGGLGAFEAVVAALLPHAAPAALAAGLLGFRLAYYVAPLMLAAGALAAHEPAARTGLHRAVRTAQAAAPLIAGPAAFALGAALILTGVAPITRDHLPALKASVPLPLLEAAHLASLGSGLALMGAAGGLWRRRASARSLALTAALAAAATALARGYDWGPAAGALALAGLLGVSAGGFYRRGDRGRDPVKGVIDLGVIAVFLGSVALGLWVYRDARFEAELFTHVGYHADPARFLRGTALLGAIIVWVGATRLARAGRASAPAPAAEALAAIRPLVEASPHTYAHLALTGDKAILADGAGEAFLMWAAQGRSLVALGDPVGEAEAGRRLLWRFREQADRVDARTVFYQVGPHRIGDYLDLGLALVKLGEEAVVPLAGFSLEGGARRNLRQGHARALREGLSFEVLAPPHDEAILAELSAVSEAWLAAHGRREKGFSLGRFDVATLRRQPVAVARFEGRIVAFANVWTGAGVEASIDLMRHRPDAPRSVMEFLLVELMLWSRAEGFERFNLGMAPLSGLAEHRLAPLWHKLGRMAARRGGRFYGFEGLRAFKQKFDPVWTPRYLACPPRQVAAALIDVARLINRPPPPCRSEEAA